MILIANARWMDWCFLVAWSAPVIAYVCDFSWKIMLELHIVFVVSCRTSGLFSSQTYSNRLRSEKRETWWFTELAGNLTWFLQQVTWCKFCAAIKLCCISINKYCFFLSDSRMWHHLVVLRICRTDSCPHFDIRSTLFSLKLNINLYRRECRGHIMHGLCHEIGQTSRSCFFRRLNQLIVFL